MYKCEHNTGRSGDDVSIAPGTGVNAVKGKHVRKLIKVSYSLLYLYPTQTLRLSLKPLKQVSASYITK